MNVDEHREKVDDFTAAGHQPLDIFQTCFVVLKNRCENKGDRLCAILSLSVAPFPNWAL